MYHNQSETLKVIIAEDEPPMLRFLHKLLSQSDGFEIIAECVSGEEALAQLSERKADLLLTDIRMPGISGLELAEKVREFSAEMSIIIITGYKSFEYAKTAIDLNIDAFITKPIDQGEFREVLSRIKETFSARRITDAQNLLSTAFHYNDEEHFSRLLQEHGCSPCHVILVFYVGHKAELFSCFHRTDKELIYILYKNTSLLFLPPSYDETIFRYITTKLSIGTRDRNTLVCAQISPFLSATPTIAEIKDFHQKHLLKMVIPGSFASYTVLSLAKKLEAAAVYSGDTKLYHELELSILSRKWDLMWQLLDKLFLIWRQEHIPASYLRKRIHSLMVLWENAEVLTTDRVALNDQMDESIMELDSYEEIEECLIRTLKAHIGAGTSPLFKKDWELFNGIKALALQDLSRNYSLQEICSIFNVSPPYVRKIFTRYADKTYNDFILGEKIQHAVRMIDANPQIPVKELAAMLGYEQLYFSTVFKKNLGMTPSQYKQEAQS